jgi:hypothetical protein
MRPQGWKPWQSLLRGGGTGAQPPVALRAPSPTVNPFLCPLPLGADPPLASRRPKPGGRSSAGNPGLGVQSTPLRQPARVLPTWEPARPGSGEAPQDTDPTPLLLRPQRPLATSLEEVERPRRARSPRSEGRAQPCRAWAAEAKFGGEAVGSAGSSSSSEGLRGTLLEKPQRSPWLPSLASAGAAPQARQPCPAQLAPPLRRPGQRARATCGRFGGSSPSEVPGSRPRLTCASPRPPHRHRGERHQ